MKVTIFNYIKVTYSSHAYHIIILIYHLHYITYENVRAQRILIKYFYILYIFLTSNYRFYEILK